MKGDGGHRSRSGLRHPTTGDLLAGVLAMGNGIHLEMNEVEILDRFLDTLAQLFPARSLAIRALDVRGDLPAIVRIRGGVLRPGIELERVTLKRSAVEKTRLKLALTESARIRISERWDSPFSGLAAGFTVPLVASRQLYGVLDVGYPLGSDESEVDEPVMLPIANHLSVALRNERLYRETNELRDYNATLIEHANVLILGVDDRWRITTCNQALCRLTGYTRADFIGSDLRQWLQDEDRDRLRGAILRAVAGGKGDAVEARLQTQRGETVRTLWSISPIRRRGRTVATVAVGQDQTRIRELQHQVIQSEKLATLGQLAAGVVHELNNPLTSITVYAEYLRKKAAASTADAPAVLDAADAEKLSRIDASAQRIMTFAKDLVQYAKPSGSERRIVALQEVVAQAFSFCEHLFAESRIELHKDEIDSTLEVYAVPGQLEQVVINLVTNAVHAVGEAGQIRFRALAQPERVGFIVEDSGPGIVTEERERVFEPFYTTKTGGVGTGLGLSIVKNIVERHGGEIAVECADAGGAGISVLLPRRSTE